MGWVCVWGGGHSQQSIRDEAQSPTSYGWMCLLMYVCGHYQQDRPGPVTAAVTPHELHIKYSQREKENTLKGPCFTQHNANSQCAFLKVYATILSSLSNRVFNWHLRSSVNKIIIALVSWKTPCWGRVNSLNFKYVQLVVITAVFQIEGCAENYLTVEKHSKIQSSVAWAADCEMEKNVLWSW